MALPSLVGITTYGPITSTASRSVAVPTVLDGDVIVAYATKSGSAAGFTIGAGSTLAGLGELASDSRSGIWSSIFIKQNASASDSGKTIVFETAGSYRASIHVAVYRNVPASAVIDAYVSNDANGSTHTIPSITAIAGGLYIGYIGGVTGATGSQTWTTPSGFVQDAQSSDAATSGGASSVLYHATAGVAAGATVGAVAVTPSVGATTYVGWALIIKERAAVNDTKPGSVKSNAGSWTAVGAADTVAAVGDSSDTTYATVANPTGAASAIEWNLADQLAAGQATFYVKARYRTAASGSITVRVRQGSTTIATFTQALTGSFVDYPFTLNPSQAAAVTDWAALSIEIQPTAA